MGKAYRKPIIQLGLLNVPIRVETLQKSHDIGFSYVCPNCKESGVKQKWWCDRCQIDHLSSVNFLRGYFDKINQKLKVFTKEQISNYTDSGKIEIVAVLPSGNIPFYLMEKTYSATPNTEIDKDGSIFGLFYSVLTEYGYTAIGKWNGKIVALIPYSDRLFLSCLYFSDEINLSETTIKVANVVKENAELMSKLLSKFEKTDIEQLNLIDEKAEQIVDMIENGTDIAIDIKHTIAKEKDLSDVLKKSIEAVM